MTDAKRSPYRERAHVAEDTNAKPRGLTITRAEPPHDVERSVHGRARVEVEASDPDAGVFSGMISPHPASTPGEAWAQRALTLIGLPLIVPAFVMVGVAHPIAWIIGACPIVLACFAAEVNWALASASIAVPFAALLVRRAIRSRIRDREILRATPKRVRRRSGRDSE